MYMRRKVCHSDRIAVTGRAGGCCVDSPQYGQQYICCSVDTNQLAQI